MLAFVSDLVHGAEMALRQVSDCLYAEAKEQMSDQGITANSAVRIISTVWYYIVVILVVS